MNSESNQPLPSTSQQTTSCQTERRRRRRSRRRSPRNVQQVMSSQAVSKKIKNVRRFIKYAERRITELKRCFDSNPTIVPETGNLLNDYNTYLTVMNEFLPRLPDMRKKDVKSIERQVEYNRYHEKMLKDIHAIKDKEWWLFESKGCPLTGVHSATHPCPICNAKIGDQRPDYIV